MNYTKYHDLNQQEKDLIDMAISSSSHSISPAGHKIGSVILCENGETYMGATNTRSRVIGSTCAERMAVDQMLYHGNKRPEVCVLVGFLSRNNWKKDSICTPCGVCLEMFWEMLMMLGIEDIDFICASWNKERILKIKLTELYPRFEAVKR